jgi:SAM-dependent methyltransferase
MGEPARYDRIGVGYQRHRRPDARIERQIHAALGSARTVVNVGAGSGSYEPADRTVVSVEPSPVMLAQHAGPRRVRGVAEHLPFADGEFDAAMAILTVHHWRDAARGLAEMRRVSQRQVVLAYDVAYEHRLWLVAEYLPGIASDVDIDAARIAARLATDHVEVVDVPWDSTDGWLGAYWRRPEAYLDPDVWGAISGIALLDDATREAGLARLADDLASGRWYERHASLLARDTMDYGYRLVVSGDHG